MGALDVIPALGVREGLVRVVAVDVVGVVLVARKGLRRHRRRRVGFPAGLVAAAASRSACVHARHLGAEHVFDHGHHLPRGEVPEALREPAVSELALLFRVGRRHFHEK